MLRRITQTLSFWPIFGLFLFPQSALAQVDISSRFPVNRFKSIGDLVSVLTANAYVVGGILFLFALLLVGLLYIFNAGAENIQKYQAIHQTLLWTVIGLLVIIASYWIIQILEVLTGFKIF